MRHYAPAPTDAVLADLLGEPSLARGVVHHEVIPPRAAEFVALANAAGLGVSAVTYDGDTPAPIRSAIRTAGQIVVTNPDMLHAAILPHHTKWFQLFEQLRVVVIDELHSYRGVFGSHVANVV